jgi:hypothetical protein
MNCTAKITTDDEDEEFGTCARCGTMQYMNAGKKEVVAHLIVETGVETLALQAIGKVVQDIGRKPAEAITKPVLLKADRFTMLHKDGIIQSVVRKVKL